jgi:hypothetical protein
MKEQNWAPEVSQLGYQTWWSMKWIGENVPGRDRVGAVPELVFGCWSL